MTDSLDILMEIFESMDDDSISDIYSDSSSMIVESDNIDISNKIELIRELQLFKESFFGFRKTLKSVEDAADNINSSIDDLKQKSSKLYKTGKVISAIALVALILATARKMIRKRKYQNCAKYSGRELYLCKINMSKAYIQYIGTQLAKCENSSDIQKCKERLEIAIRNETKTLRHYEAKLNSSLTGGK